MAIRIVVTLLLICTGCASRYSATARDYAAAAPSVSLGSTLEQVFDRLEPSQRRLRSIDRHPTERFQRGGKLVEIVYFRTGWHREHDMRREFTPYVFHDGKLVSVGWTSAGRTPARRSPRVRRPAYSSTIVPPF